MFSGKKHEQENYVIKVINNLVVLKRINVLFCLSMYQRINEKQVEKKIAD